MPSLLMSVFSNKCPHCRKGNLFTEKNPYKFGKTSEMYTECSVCGQPFELQTGFYFGTGYVSYAISVALLIGSAFIWNLTLHFSVKDNSIYYWLGTSTLGLLVLQPLIQRLSRSMWIAFFVKYDVNYAEHTPA